MTNLLYTSRLLHQQRCVCRRSEATGASNQPARLPSLERAKLQTGQAKRKVGAQSISPSQLQSRPLLHCQATNAVTESSDLQLDSLQPKRRRLIIMRHADSIERADPQTRDHERSITDIGRQAAAQTAQLLYEKGWLPEVVMSSNSQRTRQTLEAMKEAVGAFRHAETHFRGSLYTIAALDGMTRKHLQNVIVDACRQSVHDCVLCLGHNKGWEEAATSFAGRPVRLETANAALLEGSGDTWADAFASGSDWKLVGVLIP